MSTCPCCGQAVENLGLAVDLDTNTLAYPGGFAHLAPLEAELMKALVSTAPRTTRHDFIINALWGVREPEQPKITIRVLIGRLRTLLEPLGYAITPVYCIGYRLERCEEALNRRKASAARRKAA